MRGVIFLAERSLCISLLVLHAGRCAITAVVFLLQICISFPPKYIHSETVPDDDNGQSVGLNGCNEWRLC